MELTEEEKTILETLVIGKPSLVIGNISFVEYVKQNFQEIANAIISDDRNADLSFVLEEICGMDVSRIDMNNLPPQEFDRITYDEETVFSEEQIDRFNPKELLERSKSFSKEVEKLHTQGIDGRGTTIGIIDSCFDSSVPEFEGKVVKHVVFEKVKGQDFISHRDFKEEDGDGYHGKTTASLAVGTECGVAPKSEVYLFGIAEGTSWAKAKEAILKYIKNNNIELDIISMSADIETSKESQEILDELGEKGCAFIDSSTFWENFSWGRINDNGDIVLDELMKDICNLEHDENSRASKVIDNISNTVIFPCTGRTSLQIGKKNIYKYNGSICGASFAIPQLAGLFAIARQLYPTIKFNEFIEITKNPQRLNSEGLMYLDVEEMVKRIKERSETKTTQNLSSKTIEEQENTLTINQEMKEEATHEFSTKEIGRATVNTPTEQKDNAQNNINREMNKEQEQR